MMTTFAMGKLALAAVLGLAPISALAQDDPLPAGFTAEPLLKATKTRDGVPVVYPTGTPEIISVIGTLEPDGRTALHQHPVPVYVYILEGEVEVKSVDGEPVRYKAGEAYIEAQNHTHQAFNAAGGPTKLLVVFMGEEGSPTTVAEGQ